MLASEIGLKARSPKLDENKHQLHRSRSKEDFERNELKLFSYQSIKAHVLGAKKNCLNETVLLSTHNMGFGCEIRKLFLNCDL